MEKFEKIRYENSKEEVRRFDEICEKFEDIRSLLQSKDHLRKDNIFRSKDYFLKYTQDIKDINEKIKIALKQHGYDENYLDPIYTCSICKDQGYVYVDDFTKKRCICNREEEKFNVCFDDIDLNILSKEGDGKKSHYDCFKEALDYSRKYVEQFPNNDKKNILLFGASGRGKSYLANAICKEVYDRGYTVCKVNAFKLIEEFKNKHVNDAAYSEDFFCCDLLVIDDIGTEPIYKNITIEYLFALINERLENSKHTIFVTNLSYVDCAKRYDERIASRIFDDIDTKRIALMGENLRLIKK